MCSYTVLQEALDLSKPTITRAIRTLKELGFIAIYKSGTSNVYTVNDNVFWKSWGNKKRYSKFPANVILAESEHRSMTNYIEFILLKHIEEMEKMAQTNARNVLETAKSFARMQFAQYGMTNLPDDVLAKYATEMLNDKKQVENLVARTEETKIAQKVRETAAIEEKTVSLEEFNKLFEEGQKAE